MNEKVKIVLRKLIKKYRKCPVECDDVEIWQSSKGALKQTVFTLSWTAGNGYRRILVLWNVDGVLYKRFNSQRHFSMFFI